MINELGYAIGVLTSILCAVLLIRAYLKERTPLLLWCSLCFAGLAVNNVLLFTDLFVVTDINLEVWRSLSAFVALSLMLIGLIWGEA
jgi:hypothetical protein